MFDQRQCPTHRATTPDAGAVSMHFTALPPQLLAQRRAKLHRGMATVEREDDRHFEGGGMWILDELGWSVGVGDGPAALQKKSLYILWIAIIFFVISM